MTREQLDAIFDRVRAWPVELQQEVIAVLLALEADADDGAYEPTPEERAELQEALAEIDRGEVATDAEVAAAFRRQL